jgi:hypothetical protein
MPINMFFIVKNHWEPSFTDNLQYLTLLPSKIQKWHAAKSEATTEVKVDGILSDLSSSRLKNYRRFIGHNIGPRNVGYFDHLPRKIFLRKFNLI